MAAAPGHDASARDILALAPDGPDRFVASGGATNPLGTVYGGRLIGQALRAAAATQAALPLASMHAYFLAAGDLQLPVHYEVMRLRDSRRFANRQVHARQNGRLIFTLLCEFHATEDSFAHQAAAMPAVPPPGQVPSLQEVAAKHAEHPELAGLTHFRDRLPVELRPVAPEAYLFGRPADPARAFWFRVPGAAACDDPRLQQCLLAYASDYWLAGAAAITHALPTNGRDLLISSLDHAIWFHRPVRCDEWLLHHTHSPSAGDGLGLAQGRIFARDGRLIATTTQECLLRRRTPSSPI